VIKDLKISITISMNRIEVFYQLAAGTAKSSTQLGILDQPYKRSKPFLVIPHEIASLSMANHPVVATHGACNNWDAEGHVLQGLETALSLHPFVIGKGIEANIDPLESGDLH
jgi:hypothetical protein